MKPKLPSLVETLKQTIKLYGRTYIDALPFLLLLSLGQLGLMYLMAKFTDHFVYTFLIVIANIALISVFYAIMLYGMNHKLVHQRFDYILTLKQGLKRSIPLFGAYIIVSLPILIALWMVALIGYFWQPVEITPQVEEHYEWFMLGLILLSWLISLVIGVYCFIAGVLIVVKNINIFESLKQSWRQVRGYWLNIFLTLFVIILLEAIIRYTLTYFEIDYLDPMMNLVTGLLYPALMVVRFNQLIAP